MNAIANASHRSLRVASEDAPIFFTIELKGCASPSLSVSFHLEGPDRRSGETSVREYKLSREHRLSAESQKAYLDLFEKLASDFGTRIPSSRCPGRLEGCTVPLRPLLTDNISPDILYGYGDPDVLRVVEHNGRLPSYYIVVTSGDAPKSFPILCTRDFRSWVLASFAFPDAKKPPWAANTDHGGEFWAPQLSHFGHTYLLSFAAREKDQSLAIGLAWSKSPTGPFVASPLPLIKGGVIDPHVFVDDDGSAILLWKRDNNDLWPSLLNQLLHDHSELIGLLFPALEDRRTACLYALLWPWVRTLRPMERFFALQVLIEAAVSNFPQFRARVEHAMLTHHEPATRIRLDRLVSAMRTVIYGQRLDTRQWVLTGQCEVVLENDLIWEGALVEGPWITKKQGRYYIFYSGNDFSTAQYGIGIGVADHPLGPYKKNGEPFLSSTTDWWGPGHPCIEDGPDGRPWLFCHGYRPGHAGYKEFRALLGAPLTFAGNSVHAVMQPRSVLPSGTLGAVE